MLISFIGMQLDGIKEYWSFCGEIEDLDVMRFPDTGRFKGIAFITYTTVSFETLVASCVFFRFGVHTIVFGAYVAATLLLTSAACTICCPVQQHCIWGSSCLLNLLQLHTLDIRSIPLLHISIEHMPLQHV